MVGATATRRKVLPVAGRRTAPERDAVPPLTAIDLQSWRELAARALEPNGYYLPDWELAVSASAQGRTGAAALAAWRNASPAQSTTELAGLLPVVSLWRAYRIPLPALVSAHPYGVLGTPLLDGGSAHEAAAALLDEARRANAHALILRDVTLDGAALQALTHAMAGDDLKPHVLNSHARACLDATQDPEQLLRTALGAKKLKELRRQHHRMTDQGELTFSVARSPDEVARALETFLILEAGGWKGARGTALTQHGGDATFIRSATVALAAQGQCQIVMLRVDAAPIAAGIVLRHRDRAFYFKIGIDERFAKFSPGVQLTLELTRHLCADPAITTADSTAAPGHPMIDPIWRGRLRIGDVMIPLRCNDPVVPLIHTALATRRMLSDFARTIVRPLRDNREKNKWKDA